MPGSGARVSGFAFRIALNFAARSCPATHTNTSRTGRKSLANKQEFVLVTCESNRIQSGSQSRVCWAPTLRKGRAYIVTNSVYLQCIFNDNGRAL